MLVHAHREAGDRGGGRGTSRLHAEHGAPTWGLISRS